MLPLPSPREQSGRLNPSVSRVTTPIRFDKRQARRSVTRFPPPARPQGLHKALAHRRLVPTQRPLRRSAPCRCGSAPPCRTTGPECQGPIDCVPNHEPPPQPDEQPPPTSGGSRRPTQQDHRYLGEDFGLTSAEQSVQERVLEPELSNHSRTSAGPRVMRAEGVRLPAAPLLPIPATPVHGAAAPAPDVEPRGRIEGTEGASRAGLGHRRQEHQGRFAAQNSTRDYQLSKELRIGWTPDRSRDGADR